MKRPTFHKGAVVIDVHAIQFAGKDIITLKDFEDLKWLVGNGAVFKLKNSYYCISDAVAYIWTDKTEKINKNEGCQVQDVTEHLGLSRPLTSAILKSMEELGLIKRDFGEGRAVLLKITEHGKEVLNNDK
jgi:predicted transcriptional regulator